MQCTVCGGVNFNQSDVLWDELIKDWQLNPIEIEYINRQQGKFCTDCSSNVRSIALANSIRSYLKKTDFLANQDMFKQF